jgi:hypothetical protein
MLDRIPQGLYHPYQYSDRHFTGKEAILMNAQRLSLVRISVLVLVLVLLIIGGPPSGGFGA